jgi:hypothetical protein
MNMKKILLICFFLLLGTLLFSQVHAVIKEVSGKVEIKATGDSWIPAEEGMELLAGYFISTGFRSQAVLELGPSQLIVKQLTRMELEELIEKEDTISTRLNLRVGKVRANVQSTEGLRQNFILRSPVSTAAVRGTSFEYDGENLKVFEGTVAFTNLLGQRRTVKAGERSRTLGYSLPRTGEEIKDLLTMVFPGGTVDIPGIIQLLEDLTNITIIINWD